MSHYGYQLQGTYEYDYAITAQPLWVVSHL